MSPIIAVDFDGTIVTHAYPHLGADIGAIPWLAQAQSRGARLILLTMRFGDTLSEAVEFCAARGLEFWAINANPEQSSWSQSPKVYAHLYIDDSALGMPLTRALGERPYIDWPAAGPLLHRWLERWAAQDRRKT